MDLIDSSKKLCEVEVPFQRNKVTGINSSHSKCGEIFVSNNSSEYIFVCLFCDEKHFTIRNFAEHIENVHVFRSTSPDSLDSSLIENKSGTSAGDLLNDEVNEDPLAIVKQENEPVMGKFNETEADRIVGDVLSEKDLENKILNEKMRSAQCPICLKVFGGRSRLKIHESVHTGVRPFKCEECGKCFRLLRQYSKHKERVHEVLKPYVCNQCGARFNDNSNLTVHSNRHNKNPQYPCDVCGKSFYTSSERKIHIMRVHTGERPFVCELCGERFKLANRLNEHKKRHTNTKDSKCEQCGKTFFNSVSLKEHMTTHSTERPFECHICKSTFRRKKNLRQHVLIHSDVKKYSCRICKKDFAQFSGLYCHMKSHDITT